MAINPTLVNGTSWNVAGLENGNLGSYHPVPWIFQAGNTVSAAGHWTGVWSEIGENRLKVVILLSNGQTDIFEVDFVTPTWFVATKGGNLYRLGKKR